MVGLVIVSHSEQLANGVKELAEMMVQGVPIAAAGGLEDGILGTSYEKIQHGIEEVCGKDGALVLVDMGSAIMTTELVLENLKLKEDLVKIADCPIAEGAVLAALASVGGANLKEVAEKAREARNMPKQM